MALSWAYQPETLPMDNTIDCPIKLPIAPGPGGDEWPDGTTSTIAFYDDSESTETIYEQALSVSAAGIFGQIESEDVATIPDNSVFRIWAVLPGTPTTEAPLYAGRVTKGSY